MGDVRTDIREFLSSRRARITPEAAGLPAYGGNRRVAGLRREEVAMLTGVSVDYYVRLERGSLAGASESVLDSLANTLKLDDAERQYLFDLARASGPARKPAKKKPSAVRPAVLQVLDAMSDAPAWVRNARHDIIAANRMGRALYSPVFDDARRPVNTTRFTYLNPAAREFWRDYDQIANDAAAMLRLEAGRNPHDPDLIQLVGELSTQSELFRERWASRDVVFHRSGLKRLHHPVVGDLDLNYESMELPSEPGLVMNVYTAPAGSPTADALRVLASWAATDDHASAMVVSDMSAPASRGQ
ncbi:MULTISPECIES: helix-turn-helix transcriptional regulator [Subtercola]|uniref:XRE family transcriptional regulator n=1 Tax=Subtercola vilae TaxID=2056433 RepID=A0A4V4RDT3_9MICO|nr:MULTISPECIES: helix-turn-helix transcriptional regulator [Subtercola]MEA9985032.1 helix-turn-helix transcriptional regulator [Subtercola sp. RTI3]TIH31214.1 XRE family transcriptional regulator [Subtercola vilae]